MKGPTPGRLKRYACRVLGLERYLLRPGDGRRRPQIAARHLVWGMLMAVVMRASSFQGVERLVRSRARRAIRVGRSFGDDTLGYFTERMDPEPTRRALCEVARKAKRNKAFDDCRFIGLAVDGSGGGGSEEQGCALCRPVKNAQKEVVGYNHHFSLISVVGTGLTLPLDVEPYGPGDSEYAASQRMLERTVGHLGRRFADYVVGDGLYASAPFLHTAGAAELRVLARLKDNLPELSRQARGRFESMPPTATFRVGDDRVEAWDADDFDPWEGLEWKTVRVLRYLQHKKDGTVVEAYWLTDFPTRQVGSRALYLMAKSRWEIENGGFNDGKNRYGMAHIHHHHDRSLLVLWLLIALAMTLERLYRQRYLHRGTHAIREAIELVHWLWLAIGHPAAARDTS